MNKRLISQRLPKPILNLVFFLSRLIKSPRFILTKVGFWKYNFYNFKELILGQKDFIVKYGDLKFYNFGREVLNEENDLTYGKLNGCKKVLDLGGYNGDTALFLAKNNNKVVVFEPEKEKFKYIKKNIGLNDWGDKIIPYNFAVVVGNKKSMKIYHTSDYDIGASTHFNNKFSRKEIVKCMDIKDVLKLEDFDGMKCDIEGGEWEIINWMIKNGKFKQFKKIIFELHFSKSNKNWNQQFEKLIDYLKGKGIAHHFFYCDGGGEIGNLNREISKILNGEYNGESYSFMLYVGK